MRGPARSANTASARLPNGRRSGSVDRGSQAMTSDARPRSTGWRAAMRLAAAVGSASATAALAAPASAQPDAPAKPRGVYVTFEGGAGWLHRMAVRCAHGTRHSSLGTKTGYGLGGAVGYAFGNGVRLEAEVPYRSNGAGALVAGSTSEPISGSVSSVALMFNALYDIAAVRVGRFTPYVGAGVGVAR